VFAGVALPFPIRVNQPSLARGSPRKRLGSGGRSWALPGAGRCDSEEARGFHAALAWQASGVNGGAGSGLEAPTNQTNLGLESRLKPYPKTLEHLTR